MYPSQSQQFLEAVVIARPGGPDARGVHPAMITPQHNLAPPWTEARAVEYSAIVRKTGQFGPWARELLTPVAIVSGDLSILWLNSSAQDMLESSDVFSIRSDGRLGVNKSSIDSFFDFMSRLADEPLVWTCPQEDNLHLVVRAESIRPRTAGPAIGLMFYPKALRNRHIWGDLGAAFGLTRSESAVAKRMVNGQSADEISGDLNVSIETIRTHIKRLYSKMGVNSREQLLSTVAMFRLS